MSQPTDAPAKLDFIREIIASDLAAGRHESVITRFPPEPNGYLHIGHAKSICLNFGIAAEHAAVDARCHLRFDDTNPEKEDVEYVESIREDVAWLGFDWGEHQYFASDYFEFFYDCAVGLIRRGLAYVDFQSTEEMRKARGDLRQPGTPSPDRERDVESNLAEFAKMRAGDYPDGACVLRAKIDLASPNMNLRDPVIYRIMHATHHNTGDSWCIYPMYDFAHPLEDAKEMITHSLCTLEFENHRPLYDWFIDHCAVPSRPRQIEFARLNLGYTIMSKRKLLELVKHGHVQGWDDPRLPTISGIRRRGYPPEAIRAFCQRVGLTKFQSLTDVALLEFEVREFLNFHSDRRMAVLDPVKVTITNWPVGEIEACEVAVHPQRPELGSRKLELGSEIWIEREDFMAEPVKKFFRLGPDRYVRLRGGPIIHCTGFDLAEDGSVSAIRAEFLPGTTGMDAPEGVKCKAAIHWVGVADGIEAEVRLYDRLFTLEEPDSAPDGFLSVLNPDSLRLVRAYVEPALAACAPGDRYQFERIGYFIADAVDHQPGTRPVFNRTVALKDSWNSQSPR